MWEDTTPRIQRQDICIILLGTSQARLSLTIEKLLRPAVIATKQLKLFRE